MIGEIKPLRLVNETGDPYDWKLLDENGENIFQKLMVSRLQFDSNDSVSKGIGTGKLILECFVYPGGINADIAVLAENIGIKIIEHRVITHIVATDEQE